MIDVFALVVTAVLVLTHTISSGDYLGSGIDGMELVYSDPEVVIYKVVD